MVLQYHTATFGVRLEYIVAAFGCFIFRFVAPIPQSDLTIQRLEPFLR